MYENVDMFVNDCTVKRAECGRSHKPAFILALLSSHRVFTRVGFLLGLVPILDHLVQAVRRYLEFVLDVLALSVGSAYSVRVDCLGFACAQYNYSGLTS